MTTQKTVSRGDHTRERLVLAALEVFGRAGFDAASTRAIAEVAGVNQALIGYHFGGKQGLYIGVFEHIIDQMRRRMTPAVEQVTSRLAAAPQSTEERRELALELLMGVFDTFTDMIGEQFAAGSTRLILREQRDPTEAFQLLYDNVLAGMLSVLTRLVAMATGLDETSEACRIRSVMMIGQVLVFYVARGSTTRFLNWDGVDADNIAALKQQFRLVLETQLSQGVATS